MKFCLKNGEKISKKAFVPKEDFDKFKQSVIEQITEKNNKWFYFIEEEEPYCASMFRIEDISFFEMRDETLFNKYQEFLAHRTAYPERFSEELKKDIYSIEEFQEILKKEGEPKLSPQP